MMDRMEERIRSLRGTLRAEGLNGVKMGMGVRR